jgi:lipopolysaccharide biosynthesis protein
MPEMSDEPPRPAADQPNSGSDLVDALQAEVDALQIKVDQLDAAATEYRRQMAVVLDSLSWRVTSPIRASAARLRVLRRRLAAWARRARSARRSGQLSTVGLFPPSAPPTWSLVTASSPLLSRPHRNARAAAMAAERGRAQNRVLVVAHAFYPEVWPDIEDRLVRMPEPYDLIVTLVRGRAESLHEHIRSRFPNARIHVKDNYGRDLASLLELAEMGVFEGYDAILKVHTKRSPHRFDGDAWRLQLLDGVLPSPSGIRRILELLRRDESVGLVAPEDSLKGSETWGSDRELVEALAARIPFAFDPEQLVYPAGSMYWVRPWILQRLADLGLSREHFEPEAGHYDGSTAHALERFVGLVASTSGLSQVETHAVASRLHRARRRSSTRPRVLAFYLPQLHQVPENDAWWGEGFTDWLKVDNARPLYDGHLQPVQPGELGRYDLADPEVLRSQATLARSYGVDGFVMHHYWFNGRLLLDTPLRQLLADPSIDLPFALCWANENWTRRWDGLDDDVLITQDYEPGWADRFYDDLLPALRDPRHLRIDGKPMFVVYRIADMPDAKAVIAGWKQRAQADGLGGLHVLAVTPSRDFEAPASDVASAIDGWIRFPPGSGIGLQSVRSLAAATDATDGDIYSYDAAVDGADLSTSGPFGLPLHPGVMPGWDNTPRRGPSAYVFHGANPLSFRRWLSRAAAAAAKSDRIVFVNAWNEWAEGAHLEPDARLGRANLEAVRDVVGRCPDYEPSDAVVDLAAAGQTIDLDREPLIDRVLP